MNGNHFVSTCYLTFCCKVCKIKVCKSFARPTLTFASFVHFAFIRYFKKSKLASSKNFKFNFFLEIPRDHFVLHHPRLQQLVRRLHPRSLDIAGPISGLKARTRLEDLQSRVHGPARRGDQHEHARLRQEGPENDDGAQQNRLSAVPGI